ncbi:hypothetical protein ACP70R_015063 [Stipagrostis hirtigluma subsp. patula]
MAMAKAMLAAVVAVAAVAAQVAVAAAVDHPVGGSGAWDASGTTSYSSWSAKQKFVQGDTLSFKYASSHDVTEVDKAGYDACSGSKPVKSYTGGATKVTLTAPGKRYFICSVPGHCAAGMKLEVTVAAAAATAPAPAPAVTATPAPAPAKSKPRHHRSVAPNPAPAAAPAKTKSKPRHHKRSVAPNPAPAAATPAAAPSTTDDEMPTVSPSTEEPTQKSSAATCIRMLRAKTGMVLAVVMALVLAM